MTLGPDDDRQEEGGATERKNCGKAIEVAGAGHRGAVRWSAARTEWRVRAPVCVFMMLTEAPGITAPLSSVTVPIMEPYKTWAFADGVTPTMSANTSKALNHTLFQLNLRQHL